MLGSCERWLINRSARGPIYCPAIYCPACTADVSVALISSVFGPGPLVRLGRLLFVPTVAVAGKVAAALLWLQRSRPTGH